MLTQDDINFIQAVFNELLTIKQRSGEGASGAALVAPMNAILEKLSTKPEEETTDVNPE